MLLRMIYEASWWPSDDDDPQLFDKIMYDPYYSIKRGHTDRAFEPDSDELPFGPEASDSELEANFFEPDYEDHSEVEELTKLDYGSFNEPEPGMKTDTSRADKSYGRRKDIHRKLISNINPNN